MSLTRFTLRQIEAFVVVAELHRFSGAAEARHRRRGLIRDKSLAGLPPPDNQSIGRHPQAALEDRLARELLARPWLDLPQCSRGALP